MKAFLCSTEQTAAKMCLQQAVVVWLLSGCGFWWEGVHGADEKGGEKGSHGEAGEGCWHLRPLRPALFSIAFTKVLVTKLRKLYLG